MKLYILGVVGLVTGSQAGLAASLPTVAAIDDSIHSEGAKATIANLAKADQWDAVVEKIGSGDRAWIALAPALSAGSDAGSSEDLGISLAFSLPKNPRAVLAVLDPANGPAIGANRVCGIPFLEDTVKDLPAYRRKAVRAVRAVRDRMLAPAKAACLAALREAGASSDRTDRSAG